MISNMFIFREVLEISNHHFVQIKYNLFFLIILHSCKIKNKYHQTNEQLSKINLMIKHLEIYKAIELTY